MSMVKSQPVCFMRPSVPPSSPSRMVPILSILYIAFCIRFILKEGPRDLKNVSRLLISSPQTGLIIWSTRGGCEKHRFRGCSPGDPDSANWESTVGTATVHTELFHLPLQIHEKTDEGWRWQMITVNNRGQQKLKIHAVYEPAIPL